MTLIAVGLMLPLSVVEFALGHVWPWKTLWLAACALAAIWLRTRERPPGRWVSVAVAAVFTAAGPLSVGVAHPSFVELATIGAMPLVAAVLFLEAFPVVVAIAIAGWVANTVLFSSLGWPARDVVSVSVRLGAAALVMVLVSYWTRRMRRLARELEREQARALRLSESRLAQAERLAIVGRLASGIAHEINNPMAYVKANVNVLERHFGGLEDLPAEEVREVLAETREGIDRINQIVADLKSYARDDSEVAVPVDLEEVVRQSARLAAVRLPPSTSLRIECAPNLPKVHANARKLSQVVLNLLINAGDALDGQPGTPAIAVTALVTGEGVVLHVEDNGPGIPEALMGRLFEPFFTTKPPGKGTGLGLALSREYAQAFGAALSASNVQPHGARFSLCLKSAA